MSEDVVEEIIETIGSRCDGPRDWASVAMACIDQAGASVELQDRIADLLQSYGIDAFQESTEPVVRQQQARRLSYRWVAERRGIERPDLEVLAEAELRDLLGVARHVMNRNLAWVNRHGAELGPRMRRDHQALARAVADYLGIDFADAEALCELARWQS